MNNEHCEHREQNKQASSEFTGEAISFKSHVSNPPPLRGIREGPTGQRPLEQAT